MLMIVLRILFILGILLLILLLLAVTVLLLVLFCPVTYRVCGAKNEEGFRVDARMKWLLGLVRFRYGYPEPGELVAKILFFTLYRVKIPSDEAEKEDDNCRSETEGREKRAFAGKRRRKIGTMIRKGKRGTERKNEIKAAEPVKADSDVSGINTAEAGSGAGGQNSGKTALEAGIMEEQENASTGGNFSREKGASMQDTSSGEENDSTKENISVFGKILQKFEKIKYTIHSLYDKMKEIWNNISYYLELLQEEEVREVFSRIWLRTGKVLKSVCPRHIRANILFGTGHPDTTGYLYGAFCMFSPMLGKEVCVTPNFEEAVLQADFAISGHIAIWVLVANGVKVALDKRLRRLIKKATRPGKRAAQKKAA